MNGGAGQEIVYFEKLKNSPNEIVMNTVIASATSGLTMVAMNQYKNIVKNETVREQTGMIQQNNVFSLCCSIISGLVSITACCNSVSPLSSAFIGFFGCIIYQQTKWLLRRYEIDDPLDVTQTHGICGVWALIAAGLLDDKRGVVFTHKLDFIGVQLLGAICLILWSGIMSFIFFYILKKNGKLRVSGLIEVIGSDIQNLGNGYAQNIQGYDLIS